MSDINAPGSFLAKYDGRCPACPNPITPGDPVIYVDDVVTHLECEGDALGQVLQMPRRPVHGGDDGPWAA